MPGASESGGRRAGSAGRCIVCVHLLGVVTQPDGRRVVCCSLPWPPCQFEPRPEPVDVAFIPPRAPGEPQRHA